MKIIPDIFDLIDPEKSEKEQLKQFSRYRKQFILLEAVSFIAFLSAGIITLIDFIFVEKFEIFEFFQTPQFYLTVISGIIFFIGPSLLKWLYLRGRDLISEIRIDAFKNNFVRMYRGYSEFDLKELSEKHNIDYDDMKDIFEDLIADGVIKGNLRGQHFELNPNFQIRSVEEANVEKFKENIIDYIKPYRWLSVTKTAKYFGVPEEIARSYIVKLLEDGAVKGFLDGDSLVRELSVISADLSDLPECPYCDSKVLAHSRYCSNCGKEINFDDLTDLDSAYLNEE